MRKNLFLTLSVLFIALGGFAVSSCSKTREKSTDSALFPKSILDDAIKSYQEKCSYLGLPVSDHVPAGDVSQPVQEALDFLYGYLITPDMLDYSVDFYVKNIETTYKAREEMPWGKSIPAEVFRHFVLPVRVNNEALDNSRELFYEELKHRVKDLSMMDAVLEVTHWCHEHVTYDPSDGRTSSPISPEPNALGRCGEESTFTVAAMRSVGIPARQVYTPRWAHTDDNHAWVEAWVDGKWYYLGACEPAPVLNNAWFDAPVRRAMMLHTKAFGAYTGAESSLKQFPTYTELNLTSLYVPTASARVKVLKDGVPQKGVKVSFRLYNYAEFYPITNILTDENGEVALETGIGDMLATAEHGIDAMDMGVVRAGGETLVLNLRPFSEVPSELHWVINPPEAVTPSNAIDSTAITACAVRIVENDSIRKAYLATFPGTPQVEETFKSLGLKNKELWSKIYVESRGHHHTVLKFMENLAPEQREQGLLLLSSLTKKDLHDVPYDVLTDVMKHYKGGLSEKEVKYRLSPRVGTEQLFPVHAALNDALALIFTGTEGATTEQEISWSTLSAIERADKIATYLRTFKVDELYNPIRHALSPATVLKNKVGDVRSLAFTFVRLCRAAGVLAEYDGTIGISKIYTEDGGYKLYAIAPEEESKVNPDKVGVCSIKLNYQPLPYLSDPKYYYNFSLGYISPSGAPVTYDMKDGLSYKETVAKPLEYENNYIITGTRLASGGVLVAFRKLTCGDAPNLMAFDRDTTAISVIGSMNPEALYHDLKTNSQKTLLSSTGRGYYVLVLGKDHHEPTDHILRDLRKSMWNEAEKSLALPVVVIQKTQGDAAPSAQVLLPEAFWGKDIDDSILKLLTKGTETAVPFEYPLLAVCDTFGRVVFVSQGYTIGIGDRIAKVVSEVK
ncbi:MAG: transglutaminase-like domain-containing protein [Porphyromonas sp.]|nr:transglutaminase-like domain-containing protein [Porphyromonas sp.]